MERLNAQEACDFSFTALCSINRVQTEGYLGEESETYPQEYFKTECDCSTRKRISTAKVDNF